MSNGSAAVATPKSSSSRDMHNTKDKQLAEPELNSALLTATVNVWLLLLTVIHTHFIHTHSHTHTQCKSIEEAK